MELGLCFKKHDDTKYDDKNTMTTDFITEDTWEDPHVYKLSICVFDMTICYLKQCGSLPWIVGEVPGWADSAPGMVPLQFSD